MSTRNIETYRASHAAFNARDWTAAVQGFAPTFTYTDHARDLTVKSPQEFVGWLQAWTDTLSDAQVTDAIYYDAGDAVVCTFTGRGTNDGPIGPFQPSGRRVALQCCEIIRFNEQGEPVGGELFYDQMGLLVQTGNIEPPPPPAA